MADYIGPQNIDRLSELPRKPRGPQWLTRFGIGKKSHEDYRRIVEEQILKKYQNITDPELHRMMADVMNFLENSAKNIESATSDYPAVVVPIGEYKLRDGLKIEIGGNSGYRTKLFSNIHWDWNNLCRIELEIKYRSQDNPHKFNDLLKDVSKLAEFMPLDHEWAYGAQYLNDKKKYKVGSSWCNGKISLSGNDNPDAPDNTGLYFMMVQENIPLFLKAVCKIKEALKTQHIEGTARKSIGGNAL